MTLPDLVERVKVLDSATSAKQIEKFIVELLGEPKRGQFMITLYRRQVLARLKRARE